MNYERAYWKLKQRIEEISDIFKTDILVAEQSGEHDHQAHDRLMILGMVKS